MVLQDYLLFDSCSPLATIDSFHHLTRSMRQLTDIDDHVLALTGDNVGLGNADKGAAAETRKRKAGCDASPRLLLPLRPRIVWNEDADGFVLTAETPGLSKDELNVEVLDEPGHAVLEVSGQTAVKPAAAEASQSNDISNAVDANKTDVGKPQSLRATYRAFKERVRLPRGIDREAMRAKYEDGLLVVTIPRVKTGSARRQAIAIS